jgi:YVTN family beta-propeller protein
MPGRKKVRLVFAGLLVFSGAAVVAVAQKPGGSAPLSPVAIEAAPGGKSLFVACFTGKQVIEWSPAARKIVRKLQVPGQPSGLALAPGGQRLYVTCAAPTSSVAVLDLASGRVVESIPAGHTAMSPVVSPDGTLLYVVNRFNDEIAVIDLRSGKPLRRVRVEREPVAAAPTRDGKLLLVANFMHAGRSDVENVSAAVSVVDPHAGRVVKTIRLPNGAGQLQDIRISPDGRYAAIAHVLARHQVPTSQVDRGWMNTNAVSILDVAGLSLVNTVLLDGPMNGAANPWGVAWSTDGRQLAVAHSGAHELSITEFPALLKKLAALPVQVNPIRQNATVAASLIRADVPNDLSFLTGLRRTVRLPDPDRGPRGIAIAGGRVYSANYFSDSLTAIELAGGRPSESIALGTRPEPDLVRRGEFYFHDADICFERWQTCTSCHPGEARSDSLNWDLLNDGIGNPKNSKSMLLSHRTPPAMSLGIRDTAETAVRSGIRNILFTQPPAEVAEAIDAYLKSLKPLASPRLVNGKLSAAALRGREIFDDKQVACGSCHATELFTDLKSYDVGTEGRFDPGPKDFDTPTLVEVWRTAPYLHDGSAPAMRDVLTTKNPKDKHGKTSHLTPKQIEDLAEYILSL